MAKRTYSSELEDLKNYLKSDSNEDAKRPLLYPLFKKLFGDQFKIESDAHGADVYVAGQLIVESKSSFSQWLSGFFQALHYHKKFGLAYTAIIVIAHEFVGIWKLNKIPEYAAILSNTSDPNISPNKIGKENARKTQKAQAVEIKNSAFYWLEPRELKGDIFAGAKNLTTETFEILKILNNLDSNRLQINTHNFIQVIERMKIYFENPIDAIHAFYSIVNFWDITSTVAEDEHSDEIRVIGFKGHKFSDPVAIHPKHKKNFIKFIENQYVFTNEGSGLTADYYFSRFDEVLTALDPDYAKQHGIFFTDGNLSKFAMWFVHNYYKQDLGENYIVFDPAGGSGNLVTSWRGNLKHKIVSELQPDLLRTIEKRMRIDPYHIDQGFTIIPKTSENRGLNFLDISASEYLGELTRELERKQLKMDKPLAFLLNPPYKNTDENVKNRESKEAEYEIESSILELTGSDAGKERYLAFLGQILLMCKEQAELNTSFTPQVFIFTPTSWLIPRPTYVNFREHWDQYFQFENGFLVTSNEFFKLDGKWPLAFTIWNYQPNETGNKSEIKLYDFTGLKRPDLNYNWNIEEQKTENELKKIISRSHAIQFNQERKSIKEWTGQSMNDFKRSPTQTELRSREVYGGLPIDDERRGNKKTYGTTNSSSIGFMDNTTPVRIKSKEEIRFGYLNHESVWFRFDTAFLDINKTKCFNGSPDQKGYSAYDLTSAQKTFCWFALSKSFVGKYPIWANQFDIWKPNIASKKESYFYSLCFAFGFAENRCVVTKFEADNPVPEAPEVFVDNPMSPNNLESFWNTTLKNEILSEPNKATLLVSKITELYQVWNREYCKGETLEYVGLHDEPYFKYFDYPDFLTPNSGLIQIKKYAELEGLEDLQLLFSEVSNLTKEVKEEIYSLLVKDFKYFE